MKLLPGGVENGRCHVCFKFTTGSSRTCRTPPRAVLLHDADPAIMGLKKASGWWWIFGCSNPRILNMIIAIYSNEYGRLEMESDLLFQRDPRRRVTWSAPRQFPSRRMEIGPLFDSFSVHWEPRRRRFFAFASEERAKYCCNCLCPDGDEILHYGVQRNCDPKNRQ